MLSAERLDAERLKFGVGLSTSFLVFQAQRDFVTARVTELRAILDYNKSLADFEARLDRYRAALRNGDHLTLAELLNNGKQQRDALGN